MEYLSSFLFGGTLCLIGQIIIEKTKLTPARILVGYVVAGVLLSAVGVYDKILEIGASGASVPLTGFGHILAKATREAIDKDGPIGIFTGSLMGAAGGIESAVIFSWLAALLFRAKKK
ncbi:MAG: stage V sporulation protein AE [Clostridia bacterium]|nr:stage V sporulation protein AE [Oscillospiraceae bacterium]MBQ4627687.1 stage V sporulation protein AE [Clostridia bacterium]